MWTNLTLKKVITGVKLSVLITCSWPFSENTMKFKIVCIRVYQYICAILAFGLFLSLGNTAKNHFYDFPHVVESITLMCPSSHVILTIVSCHVNTRRLQSVTFEMEDLCESMNPHDEAVVQRYIKKCLVSYGFVILFLYMTSIVVIIGPIMLDQPFPIKAEYPFDVHQQPLKSIVYLHQCFVLLQISGYLSMNVYESVLLWFTSARFEMLADEIRAIRNINDLLECTRKHNKLIKYAEDVITVVCPCAFSTIANCFVSIAAICLTFVISSTLEMKIQCFNFIVCATVVVFVYAWPAEQLIYTSCEIGQAIYEVRWYKLPIALHKNIQFIMLRAHRSLVIAVPCFMPSLSLNFYASYLTTIFSYFTALRTFMHIQENEN